jgi:hypothetical protein
MPKTNRQNASSSAAPGMRQGSGVNGAPSIESLGKNYEHRHLPQSTQSPTRIVCGATPKNVKYWCSLKEAWEGVYLQAKANPTVILTVMGWPPVLVNYTRQAQWSTRPCSPGTGRAKQQQLARSGKPSVSLSDGLRYDRSHPAVLRAQLSRQPSGRRTPASATAGPFRTARAWPRTLECQDGQNPRRVKQTTRVAK